MELNGFMADGMPWLLLAEGALQGDETLAWLLIALLATVVMFGTFCSYLLVQNILRRFRAERGDDSSHWHPFRVNAFLPLPKDCDCRWMAIKTANPVAVLEALQLANALPCSWEEGIACVAEKKLYVTPPVNGWIFILGGALPDPSEDVDVCFRFLTALSRKVGHVQYYSYNRSHCHHGWVVLDNGEILRAYAWAGRTLWNQGEMTNAEKQLGIRCLGYGEEFPKASVLLGDPLSANTDKVPLLAARWSLNLAVLGRTLMEARRGLMGDFSLSRSA